MSNTLEERLRTAKIELVKVSAGLLKHSASGKVPPEVIAQFNQLAAFEADVDAWLGMLAVRAAARQLLTGLENQVDGADTVLLGTVRAKYQHVRLIGMQAYLATKWALAGRFGPALDEYPGAGSYAALKVHKTYSVGIGSLVAAHISPAAQHDSRHLHIDESWRGCGLLVDLGYASVRTPRCPLCHSSQGELEAARAIRDSWQADEHLRRGYGLGRARR